MPPNLIQIISFDATGVLFEPNPSIGAIYSQVLDSFDIHLSEDELDRRFLVEFHKVRSKPVSSITEASELVRWRQVVKGILGEYYSEPIFKAFWQAFESGENWKRMPKVEAVLQQLRDDGFRLIVVSNWDKRIYSILDQLKIRPFFEAVFISSELGVEKPSPEVFNRVAQDLNAPIEAFLHVGDSRREDLEAPAQVGWKSLLISQRIPTGINPERVLRSISQLPPWLRGWKGLKPE